MLLDFRRADLTNPHRPRSGALFSSKTRPHDESAGLASEYGFGSGNDKKLNRAVGDFLAAAQSELGEAVVEKRLEYLPLIPDLAIDGVDEATCIELHWRSGDFLTTMNRSEIAQYVLKKLKSYAVESGWASD